MKQPEATRGVAGAVETLWYGTSPVAWMLLPFAALYQLLVALRRAAYGHGWLKVHRLPVPVIVVGNITTGGTGKTPVTAWLVKVCVDAGLRPGIVSRGYGGQKSAAPRLVGPQHAAADVGDEPLLLHRLTGVPVCVHPDRVAAGRRLLAEGVNVVIADDGLQHYRLHRDMEIAVIDGTRRFGNGFLLPAGPLREPAGRLASVDVVLVHGGPAADGQVELRSRISGLRRLGGSAMCALESLRNQEVRAVAGIGNPGRFYTQLTAAGLVVQPVPVPDHGRIDLDALARASAIPVVMTAKDAVKYSPAGNLVVWVAELEIEVPVVVAEQVIRLVQEHKV